MTFPATLDAGIVRLRRLTARDAPVIQRLANDAAVAMMTATIPHPYPRGAAHAWIATHAAGRRDGEFVYGVIDRDNRIVGTLGLRIAPNPHGNLGYWIGRRFWGHGYATAAARAGIDLLFERSQLAWLMAAHLARNRASAQVLAKCGMRDVARGIADHRGRRAVLVLRRIDRADWARHRAVQAKSATSASRVASSTTTSAR